MSITNFTRSEQYIIIIIEYTNDGDQQYVYTHYPIYTRQSHLYDNFTTSVWMIMIINIVQQQQSDVPWLSGIGTPKSVCLVVVDRNGIIRLLFYKLQYFIITRDGWPWNSRDNSTLWLYYLTCIRKGLCRRSEVKNRGCTFTVTTIRAGVTGCIVYMLVYYIGIRSEYIRCTCRHAHTKTIYT